MDDIMIIQQHECCQAHLEVNAVKEISQILTPTMACCRAMDLSTAYEADFARIGWWKCELKRCTPNTAMFWNDNLKVVTEQYSAFENELYRKLLMAGIPRYRWPAEIVEALNLPLPMTSSSTLWVPCAASGRGCIRGRRQPAPSS